jgi:gliding motility-associated-like protein
MEQIREAKHNQSLEFKIRSHAWNVDFEGAKSASTLQTEKSLSTFSNYFIGNDPAKWASNCKAYQTITEQEIYPNIDFRYYTNNGTLKYDIVVKPGGKVSDIVLKYDGIDKIQVKKGELVLSTSITDFKESAPIAFQPSISGKQEVSCKYIVNGNRVKFDVGNYDPTTTLVIDPSIIFCSFSGSTADTWGFTATYGPDGSMYAGGIVFNNGGSFPVSTGAFETAFQGGNTDICLIRLTPDGSNRVWATYLGGGASEQPNSLIVDAQSNLYLVGRSNSADFPLVNNGSLAGTDYDIIVCKLNANGTALLGSRKIGGSGMDGVNIATARALNSLQRNYGDDGRSEVILDGNGNVVVVSQTQSGGGNGGTGKFPVTAGAFQTSFGGGVQDAVVMKWSSDLSNLIFASFLGGSANDAGYSIAINPSDQSIYVAGGTESSNLIPAGQTATVIGTRSFGDIDGYVANINTSGSSIIKLSYIGTTGKDQVYGIKFDGSGFPYIMGQTTGTWAPFNANFSNANGKQFIAKLKPDLSAFVYSTCFGTGDVDPNISLVAFLVDRCENVYLSGWGGPGFGSGFTSAGTVGLPVTPDAFKSNTDGKDFYFFVLKKDAVGQLFGSYFGENNASNGGDDHVDGGTSRFDRNGVIYQAICGNCRIGNVPRPVYPVTTGAWSTINNSGGAGCSLTMVKIAMNLAGVQSAIRSSINNVTGDTLGCVPLTVDFADTIANAQSYEWDFGDGSPRQTTTAPRNSHLYNNVGTYTVMLIAIDPTACNGRDTSYVNIRVGNIEAQLAFTPVKLAPCTAFNYRFDNLSTTLAAFPFRANSFQWDFGDNTALVTAGLASVNHAFTGPGTYNVKLILVDTTYCNAPDTLTIPISVAANVKSSFTTPATGCKPYDAVFTNTTVAGQTYNWDFGDGGTSTQQSPTHTYSTPGSYLVRLIASNPNTCNLTDTSWFTIQVLDAPVTDFSFTPVVPVSNTPITFNNLADATAVSFKWTFGDGDSLLTASRLAFSHQYKSTGTFNVCFYAYNQQGCFHKVCKDVQAVINPLVDVPNAFTPLSGDLNSVIKVMGFGIVKLKFDIWNRWGQLVFSTSDQQIGWDGKFKGQLQPMDVYMYTLSVEYFDGKKLTKKGDITLIR